MCGVELAGAPRPVQLELLTMVRFASAKRAVSDAICFVISEMVLVREETCALSNAVAVARFARASVCNCYSSENRSMLLSALRTLAVYLPVCTVLEDLRISLKVRAKYTLKFVQVF